MRSPPDLGYDPETRQWARRLLEGGDPAHPFPPGDPAESAADAARLRGVLPYLCELHPFLAPDVIESRLTRLLRGLDDSSSVPRCAVWDTTNTALRVLGLFEGAEYLHRAGLQDLVARLLPERYLERHRSVLAVGGWIEPAGNHRVVNALARVALDRLLDRRGSPDAASWDVLRAEIATQFLADGGHVERCPYYHLQVLQAMRPLLDDRERRHARPGPVAEAYANGAAALRGMSFGSRPAPFGDISRLWSGRTVDAEMQRALGDPVSRHGRSFLPESGIAALRWNTVGGHMAELLMDVGPLGLDENPGHAHDDFLTYCLAVGPVELVSDPGCYRYASDPESTWFKLARAHNVVRHEEDVRRHPRRFYRWPRAVRQGTTVRASRRGRNWLEARLQRPAGSGVTDQVRRWTVRPTGLLVQDRVVMGRAGRGVARLNLGAGCHATPEACGGYSVRSADGIAVARISARGSPGPSASLLVGRIAPAYGEVTASEALEWRFPATAGVWRLSVKVEFTCL